MSSSICRKRAWRQIRRTCSRNFPIHKRVKAFMRPILICISMGMLLAVPSAVALEREWGATVNGLRMSVGIVRNVHDGIPRYWELEWVIENTTPQEWFYLPLGTVGVGAESVRLIVSLPDGTERTATYPGSVVAGQLDPMIVPLLPESSYSSRTPISRWLYYAPDLHRLDELLSQSAALRTELNIDKYVRGFYLGNCYHARIFWTGTLVSNTLRLPLPGSQPDRSKRR